MSMQTAAIVGVGLIGTSFGLALRKSGFGGTILGVSSAKAVESGMAVGAITRRATLKEAADKADLIYLSQPVDGILETLGWLGPMARKETLITDAGSTKSAIVRQASQFLQQASFVGGHPMAGKESRGAEFADADLFRNRAYVLTPEGVAVPDFFRQLLTAMGARIIEMTAEEHDATVALTSHLPQLISTALASFLALQNQTEMPPVFGSGLLDMTRLALSPADLWSSILATNKANISHALQSYADTLLGLRQALERDDLESTFTAAATYSAQLRKIAH